MKKTLVALAFGIAGCMSTPQLIGITPAEKENAVCFHYDENSDGHSDYYECREMFFYEGKIYLGKPFKNGRTDK